MIDLTYLFPDHGPVTAVKTGDNSAEIHIAKLKFRMSIDMLYQALWDLRKAEIDGDSRVLRQLQEREELAEAQPTHLDGPV